MQKTGTSKNKVDRKTKLRIQNFIWYSSVGKFE